MLKLLRSPAVVALAFLLSMPVMATAQHSAKTSSKASPAKTSTASATAGDKIDINTATLDQLKAFPGIGDAYAKRIVDGRPYTAKNQLLSRGVLPAATYNKIKDKIIATHAKR